MKKIPRPHQVTAMAALRQSLASGKKRPILQAPTGAGKTVLAAMIIESCLAKGNRAMFVVPRLSLIDQTVQSFWDEGIRDVGVIQSNHRLTNPDRPVQVASVQTLMRRHPPETNLVIVDEAHMNFKFVNEWMALPEWLKVPFIGLSATPWTKGLGKHFDDLIIVETTEGLIEKGVLCPFRVFACAHPDLTTVKTVAGDYHEGQLAAVMATGGLVARIVDTWRAKGEGLPTLAFCVDCAHAQKVQAEFMAAGINCGYQDAYSDESERRAIREQFHDGRMQVVASVGTLTTGVDWDVRCIILARPTKSKMLYVQMIGRGLRTAECKDDCLILDFADNTLRQGFVTDIHVDKLDTGKKGESEDRKKEPPKPKECPQCSYLKPPKVHICPKCGFTPAQQSTVSEHDGELVEIKKTKHTMQEKQIWYSGFLQIAYERNYKAGWAANQYRNKFGVWPNHLDKIRNEPTPEVRSYVISQQIKYAKQKEKQHATS